MGDLTGGYSHYGYDGYDPSSEGGSRPARAPCLDDEADGREDDDDYDDDE